MLKNDMDEVSTEELEVTIKVVKVNSKKMTQSVFKQLIEKNIINNSLELDGKPWGLVNYHVTGQKKYQPNILWQKNGELFRCPLRRLNISVQKSLRIHQEQDQYMSNLHQKLPHPALVNAIKAVRGEDLACAESAFSKYQAIYEELSNLEQLFIAT